jgi:predicted peptidase
MKFQYIIFIVLAACSTHKSSNSTTTSDSLILNDSSVSSSETQQSRVFQKKLFIQRGDTLRFRLLYPLNYSTTKNYPLVLFLHGSGAQGRDNLAQLIDVPEEFIDSAHRIKYSSFVLVPQCAKKDTWVNFPAFPKSLQPTDSPTPSARLTLALVNTLSESLPVDNNKIYLTGPSMGGEGTFDFLTRKPSLFAAAIPICGVADTSAAKYIKHIPIWIFHGDQDAVNNVEYSRMMNSALKKAGGNPKYTEYKGMQHKCWVKVYHEPELFAWLFSQTKSTDMKLQ